MQFVEPMAYAGERPWHGLGNRLAPGQSIDQWKQSAGMDWATCIRSRSRRCSTTGGRSGDHRCRLVRPRRAVHATCMGRSHAVDGMIRVVHPTRP
jgi:hypothetical protein